MTCDEDAHVAHKATRECFVSATAEPRVWRDADDILDGMTMLVGECRECGETLALAVGIVTMDVVR